MLKLLFGIVSVVLIMGIVMFSIDRVINNIINRISKNKKSNIMYIFSVFVVFLGGMLITFPLIDIIFDTMLK